MQMNFIKMNGAGNDFVVLDARQKTLSLTPEKIRAIAARDNDVTKGCDQLVIIEPGNFMRLYNADGSTTNACGNATRCIAWLLMEEKQSDAVTITTGAGELQCVRAGDLRVTVDMGAPDLDYHSVANTPEPDVAFAGMGQAFLVSMGNPHAVFFTDAAGQKKLDDFGRMIEEHPAFPNRVNVSAARVIDRGHIELRVWERGAGFTQACGTAACATLVAAAQKKLTGRKADITMPGGTLTIEWRDDNHVWMTGPVETEFESTLDV